MIMILVFGCYNPGQTDFLETSVRSKSMTAFLGFHMFRIIRKIHPKNPKKQLENITIWHVSARHQYGLPIACQCSLAHDVGHFPKLSGTLKFSISKAIAQNQ